VWRADVYAASGVTPLPTLPNGPARLPSAWCGPCPDERNHRCRGNPRQNGGGLQRDSNPCFSLEMVVTQSAATRTYGAIATGAGGSAAQRARSHAVLRAARREGPPGRRRPPGAEATPARGRARRRMRATCACRVGRRSDTPGRLHAHHRVMNGRLPLVRCPSHEVARSGDGPASSP
jgi:hypothetical protein